MKGQKKTEQGKWDGVMKSWRTIRLIKHFQEAWPRALAVRVQRHHSLTSPLLSPSPVPWRRQAYAGQLDRTTLPEEFDFRGRWVSNKLDSVLSSATCFTMKSLPSLCCRPYRSDCQRLWMGYVQTVRKRGRSTPFWQQQSGFGIQGNCLFHIIFIVRVRTPACTHHTSCWPTIPVKQ